MIPSSLHGFKGSAQSGEAIGARKRLKGTGAFLPGTFFPEEDAVLRRAWSAPPTVSGVALVQSAQVSAKCPSLFGAHTRIVATKAGGVIVHFGEAKTVTIVKMSRALGVELGKEVVG